MKGRVEGEEGRVCKVLGTWSILRALWRREEVLEGWFERWRWVGGV